MPRETKEWIVALTKYNDLTVYKQTCYTEEEAVKCATQLLKSWKGITIVIIEVTTTETEKVIMEFRS